MELDFKKYGYMFSDDDTVEFYCEPSDFTNFDENEDIYVTGTFNGWLNTGDSSWKMTRKVSKGKTYFSLVKPVSMIFVPGNTGFPEFRFFGLSSKSNTLLIDKPSFKKYSFNENRLIFKTAEGMEEINRLNTQLVFKKSLSDFDLNCPACRADISNVRLVPGTKCLFRGYNPFKRSKSEFDTEDERLSLVQKAYEIYGIRSDITLNGYEGASVAAGESMPDVIKNIEKEDNRLCVNIDYNLVYFHPDAVDFSCAMRNIALFIISHPGPFYIHCRLGSDRTGVTCAVLAALCGASWKEIAYDYERTSNMGIAEYRNRRLLQYSLTKMLGRNPADSKDLAYLVQSYFIKENILTMAEIKSLIDKLLVPPKKKETGYFDFTENHICAKKNARI